MPCRSLIVRPTPQRGQSKGVVPLTVCLLRGCTAASAAAAHQRTLGRCSAGKPLTREVQLRHLEAIARELDELDTRGGWAPSVRAASSTSSRPSLLDMLGPSAVG